MRYGDRVRSTLDGRTGRAGEFTQDGQCDVTWDDGLTKDQVNHLHERAEQTRERWAAADDAQERYRAAHETLQGAYRAFCLADPKHVNKQSAAALLALIHIAAAVAVDLNTGAERFGGLALTAYAQAETGAPKWC